MKEEHYKILVERVGKEKADEILKQDEENKINREIEANLQEQREKKFLEIAIPKSELEDGVYYLGFRFRGHGIAQWDEKIGKFLIIAFEFQHPYVEKLEHFADVYEKRFDGFIPLEKIDKYKFDKIRDKRLNPDDIKEEVNKLKK